MKIAVIASCGRSGRAFVTEALKENYEVRAGIRGKSCFDPNKSLSTVQCDASNKQDIANLIKGCDAVVSLIGHVRGSIPNIQTTAASMLVNEMKKQKINRLISLTGSGVRLPGDKITLIDRVLNLGISVIDPTRVNDGKYHFEVIKSSGLDWTVIRVLKLQDTKPKLYKLTLHGPAKTIVSRSEVAQAIVELLKTNTFLRQSPIISKR